MVWLEASENQALKNRDLAQRHLKAAWCLGYRLSRNFFVIKNTLFIIVKTSQSIPDIFNVKNSANIFCDKPRLPVSDDNSYLTGLILKNRKVSHGKNKVSEQIRWPVQKCRALPTLDPLAVNLSRVNWPQRPVGKIKCLLLFSANVQAIVSSEPQF